MACELRQLAWPWSLPTTVWQRDVATARSSSVSVVLVASPSWQQWPAECPALAVVDRRTTTKQARKRRRCVSQLVACDQTATRSDAYVSRRLAPAWRRHTRRQTTSRSRVRPRLAALWRAVLAIERAIGRRASYMTAPHRRLGARTVAQARRAWRSEQTRCGRTRRQSVGRAKSQSRTTVGTRVQRDRAYRSAHRRERPTRPRRSRRCKWRNDDADNDAWHRRSHQHTWSDDTARTRRHDSDAHRRQMFGRTPDTDASSDDRDGSASHCVANRQARSDDAHKQREYTQNTRCTSTAEDQTDHSATHHCANRRISTTRVTCTGKSHYTFHTHHTHHTPSLPQQLSQSSSSSHCSTRPLQGDDARACEAVRLRWWRRCRRRDRQAVLVRWGESLLLSLLVLACRPVRRHRWAEFDETTNIYNFFFE